MSAILLGRICRTCLKNSGDMHKLREFIEDNLQIEGMLDQTVPFFDLEMDDIPLPKEICNECLSKLKMCFEFVQMCHKSNRDLKAIFDEQQEVEIIDTFKSFDGIESQEEFLDAPTDIVLENIKMDPEDDGSNSRLTKDVLRIKNSDLDTKIIKLEVEMQTLSGIKDDNRQEDNSRRDDDSQHGDNDNRDSSSDEYWPNGDKEDSDSQFFEKMSKGSSDGKSKKRKYERKKPYTRAGNNICLHCNKDFGKKNILTKHLAVHDSQNQYVCDICDFRFSTERKLKTHTTNKHTGIELSLSGGPYPCPDCHLIFQQPRALAAHSITHSEQEYKCQVCDMSLKTMAAVTRHMNCKHPDVLPYSCTICDKSFPVENQLNDHINEHMGYKKYKCDSCEKSFPHSTALKDHIRKHTGESPYLCPHCGKAFKTANALRQHLQRHGEKKFHCPECPMKFYAKISLTTHMTSHTKVKSHVCKTCGSAFTRQDSLKQHLVKHTGERPFKCEECSMRFFYKRHLTRHKITHTGEKPYMCNFCDRAYAASGDLVKHLRTHVGEKTYFCDQCSESFKYSQELKDHKVQHYKEKRDSEQKNTTTEESVITTEETKDDIEMQVEESVVTLEELYEVDKSSDT